MTAADTHLEADKTVSRCTVELLFQLSRERLTPEGREKAVALQAALDARLVALDAWIQEVLT